MHACSHEPAAQAVTRSPAWRQARRGRSGSPGRALRQPAVTGAWVLFAVFLAAAFFAAGFLAAVFLAVVFFFVAGPRARRSASSSAARSMVIDSTSSPLRRLAFVSP